MKTVTAKELRFKTSEILDEARKGNEVMITWRGKPTAILKPVENKEPGFRRTGFGVWKDRDDMQDPRAWVDERRREREDTTDTL
jgi:prevent-host-death family protein